MVYNKLDLCKWSRDDIGLLREYIEEAFFGSNAWPFLMSNKLYDYMFN